MYYDVLSIVIANGRCASIRFEGLQAWQNVQTEMISISSQR